MKLSHLLSLFIALRYTRAKKRNHFISFIAILSVLGIALGVMVLITVLSVMNGFDQQIKQKIFSMVPTITINFAERTSNFVGRTDNTEKTKISIQAFTTWLKQQRELTAIQPFISAQGVIQAGNSNNPSYIMGIEPSYANTITQLDNKMLLGQFSNLTQGSYGIVLGAGAASHLGVTLGDKVLLLTPKINWSVAGALPRLKRFTVVGIYHAGPGFSYDDNLAFIALKDAQLLYQSPNQLSGIQLKLDNPFNITAFEHQLIAKLPNGSYFTDWTQQYGSFFHAVAMEKTMMFLLLVLIIAIAVFNLVSMLVMLVHEKQADIAILRTMGASKRFIVKIFLFQGIILGILGTILGIVLGTLLAKNITWLVGLLEQLLHRHFISSDVYFIDYLPSQLQWQDVIHISLVTIMLSLVATIYPAVRASKVQPAKALRNE